MKDSHEFADLEALAQGLPKEINGYVYETKIGSGGFSRIFKCRSSRFGCDFCAKVLPLSTKQHDGCENDYAMLSHLNHPNIVRVFDMFTHSKMNHIILELCSHGSISGYSKYIVSRPEIVAIYMKQVLSAVEYCHSHHIVHRDLKPSNILIDSRGQLKLIDFGISMRVEPGTMIEDFSGSMPYSAPEVILEKRHDPYRADVWSLGVTFYWMAVGKLPWPDESEKAMKAAIEQGEFKIPDEVRPEMAQIIRRMLCVKPTDRPTLKQLIELPFFQRSCSCNTAPPIEDLVIEMKERVLPRVPPCQVPVRSTDYFAMRSDMLRGGGVRKPRCVPSRSTEQEFTGVVKV